MKQNTNTKEHKFNKKMIERIIIIHNAIKAGLYPNNGQLRRLYCEQTGYSKVGEATINRDIDILRTYYGAPLEFDRAKGGYYYTEKFDLALNSISAEEVFYLSAAKILLSSFEGSPVHKAISDVIGFVADTQGIGKSDLLKRIAVPPAPKVKIDEDIWKTMLDALQNNLIVEFDYNGKWNTETTHRRVHPYQFLFDDGLCFVFGYAEERNAERIFSLNRIKNLAVTAEHFELPKDFDFSLKCRGGKFGAFIGSGENENFVIDFYNDSRITVKERIWADDQKITDLDDEEKTRIEFSSSQWLKILEWVLAQGANAIPIEPEWFVEEWKGAIQGMKENAGI